MFYKNVMLTTAAASAVMAAAVPNPQVDPHCDGYYRVEKWNVTFTQPKWDHTRFGTFKGCADHTLGKRDGTVENPDTTVETTDDQVYTSYVVGAAVPEDEIWARAVDELCGASFCDGNKEISTGSGRSSSAEGTELFLSLDGEFPPNSGLRDNFVTLIKDAFYKSIQEEVRADIAVTHKAVSFANAVSGFGDASGYSLTMRMRNGNVGSGIDCPDTITTINSLGSLVPDLAPIFGFASAICNL